MTTLNTTLNREQQARLNRFSGRHPNASWAIDRVEGTGLRFWRFTVSTEPYWDGDVTHFEEKTLAAVIDAADLWFVRIR